MIYRENNLVPYYQPIISIENNSIYGYEVFARYENGDKVESLGDLFTNPASDPNEAFSVDLAVRKKAITEFARKCETVKHLFLNTKLDWISGYSDNPQNMETIGLLRQNGVNLHHVVIEISEDDLKRASQKAIMTISYCRSLGIKLAIDNFGKGGKSIEELADINPDIIKLDMEFVHKSEENPYYREYLCSQTELANKLGIEVAYTGIENEKQLETCIEASGRYFQGYYLAEPQSAQSAYFFEDGIKASFIKTVIKNENRSVKHETLRKKLDAFIERCKNLELFCKDGEETDEKLVGAIDIIPDYIKRIYLCNKYGFQISSNIELHDGTVSLIDNYNKNWAWRGYFKEAVYNICSTKKSYVTDTYIDISTGKKILTYVCKLNSTTFFFADISISSL